MSASRRMAGFLALVSVVRGFSLDTENAAIFRQEDAMDFGQTVVQFVDGPRRNWVGVSGRDSSGIVTLFRCDPRKGSCTPAEVKEFVNSSSPLSVSASPNQTVICDSHLVKTCLQNAYVPGVCYRFGKDFSLLEKLDIGEKDCVAELVDVVFLFDGSNSLAKLDFQNNLKFMFNMMEQADSDMQFAIVQFSSEIRTEMDFKYFQSNRKNLSSIKNKIVHMERSTKTASGIAYTIKHVFTKEAGSREKAAKLLIVITDGEMVSDTLNLIDVVELAKKNDITRCAIGVGSSFMNGSKGLKELQTIASSPDYLITVQNYDQLESIFQELKSKMFEIEGTQSDKISFEMELAQTGFSLFQSQDSILLGSVGAFDWSGGILEILADGSRTFINVSKEDVQMKDAYLGYSVTGARIANMSLYLVGAPRYRYKGNVVVFKSDGTAWRVIQNIEGDQMGSYFGSVLCAVDLSGDGETDLLLIGAPFYHALGYGGIVSVCLLSTQGTFSCRLSLRGVPGEALGRFGSSLSTLGDVTGDGVTDVAVGAPHEEMGRGAVYVFLGTASGGGVEETFSQRIAASLLAPGLRWFGRSLGGPPATPGVGRRDLAVGALGTAILLRSRPVMEVRGVVSFNPGKVKLEVWRCPWDRRAEGPQEAGTITVCFTLSGGTTGDTALPKMNLTYALHLDKNHHVSRAVFDSNLASIERHRLLSLGTDCVSHPIYLPICLFQAFTPISLNLEMSVNPLTDRHLDEDLTPVLDPNCTMRVAAQFPFHNNCGEDDECIDILHLNLSLVGEEKLLLGSPILPALKVEVMNKGEDSFNTSVRIRHPLGLSLKKTIATQTQIICYPSKEPNTSDSGNVLCNIGHPVFREGQKTSFTLTFETENFPHSMREAWIEGEARSDNSVRHSHRSTYRLTFPVVHEVDVVSSSIPTTRYVIFTNKERKTDVFHEYKVENLGDFSVQLQIAFYVSVNSKDFVSWTPEVIAPDTLGDGVKCETIFKEFPPEQAGLCSFESAANSTETFIIKGPAVLDNEPADHIQGIVLSSWVELHFNKSLYVFKTPPSTLRRECKTEVQMNLENRQDLLIYSALSGLLLFIPIILVLWKLGFFKRRSAESRDECSSEVKEMMNDSPEVPSSQPTPPIPDSQEPAF